MCRAESIVDQVIIKFPAFYKTGVYKTPPHNPILSMINLAWSLTLFL